VGSSDCKAVGCLCGEAHSVPGAYARFLSFFARTGRVNKGSSGDRACVKTPARFHTNLFRSLFQGLRAFRIGKIATNYALLDRLKNFAEFSHGLGRWRSIANASNGEDPMRAKGGQGRYPWSVE
jgi:hypothetical protein